MRALVLGSADGTDGDEPVGEVVLVGEDATSFAALGPLKARFAPGMTVQLRRDGVVVYAAPFEALGIRDAVPAGVLSSAALPAPGAEEGSDGAEATSRRCTT